MEILTLVQTHKLKRKVFILLYGTSFWTEVLNLQALARHGLISPTDLNLFKMTDDLETAFALLKEQLGPVSHPEPAAESPAIAPSARSKEDRLSS
jgi:predicted Rossmann-fold nucleotide-binding protein